MTHPTTHKVISFRQIGTDGSEHSIERTVAHEVPIALEFNGLGYAVLMASPSDLHDLVYGFALADRLIDSAEDIIDIDLHCTPKGLIARVALIAERVERVTNRVRHRTSESSCGLCGVENLEQAILPLPTVTAQTLADNQSIFRALAALDNAQPLNAKTGAVHGAALVCADGTLAMVREDVGRHNAFDKLIGAMARGKLAWDGGFALLTSRCSYELVEKAVLANCPMLVTISAPTALAVERAQDSNLALVVLARPDAFLSSAGSEM